MMKPHNLSVLTLILLSIVSGSSLFYTLFNFIRSKIFIQEGYYYFDGNILMSLFILFIFVLFPFFYKFWSFKNVRYFQLGGLILFTGLSFYLGVQVLKMRAVSESPEFTLIGYFVEQNLIEVSLFILCSLFLFLESFILIMTRWVIENKEGGLVFPGGISSPSTNAWEQSKYYIITFIGISVFTSIKIIITQRLSLFSVFLWDYGMGLLLSILTWWTTRGIYIPEAQDLIYSENRLKEYLHKRNREGLKAYFIVADATLGLILYEVFKLTSAPTSQFIIALIIIGVLFLLEMLIRKLISFLSSKKKQGNQHEKEESSESSLKEYRVGLNGFLIIGFALIGFLLNQYYDLSSLGTMEIIISIFLIYVLLFIARLIWDFSRKPERRSAFRKQTRFNILRKSSLTFSSYAFLGGILIFSTSFLFVFDIDRVKELEAYMRLIIAIGISFSVVFLLERWISPKYFIWFSWLSTFTMIYLMLTVASEAATTEWYKDPSRVLEGFPFLQGWIHAFLAGFSIGTTFAVLFRFYIRYHLRTNEHGIHFEGAFSFLLILFISGLIFGHDMYYSGPSYDKFQISSELIYNFYVMLFYIALVVNIIATFLVVILSYLELKRKKNDLREEENIAEEEITL